MVIDPEPELMTALDERARRDGVTAEALVLSALRQLFLSRGSVPPPQDEWERRLLGLARDCGVSLPDSALAREALYD